MNSRKRILIVEPSYIITEGLVKILGESTSLDVLSPLHDIECLNGRLATGKPDVLLLNPTLLPCSGRNALKGIMQEYPQMTAVALVYQYMEQSALRIFNGIVDIREEKEHISEIIMECCLLSNVNDSSPDDNSYELTKRETDVLVLIAKGLMNKEIAEKLNISIHTVISHRKNITRKTNIKSVAGLAMYALMNNLIEEGAL
ncbi:MAG: response regulator transcription factor [Tannerella sp.]|jgi:DNA-binding NarL/FixJ family response regulator|nr:response regulator transcription factor [Tannerella sp.]